MPPPTSSDSWLASRRFGIVIDAGSSGSRLQIYSWKDARAVRDAEGPKVFESLPTVEKGTQNGEDWVKKVEPGLSTFGDDPSGVASYLQPLLEHAGTHIPPSMHSETPLFLLATAGMRLLEPKQQADVLKETCQFLKFHSNFRIDDPSPTGPCGSSVRIITGEEEGLFGWISVNYLMDGFKGSDEERTTYGFLDMGGASTQIAFEPSKEEREKAKNLLDVRLRLLGGKEIIHKVFVTTWLGYGTNQARERYVGQVIDEFEASHTLTHRPGTEEVDDPCLPKGLRLEGRPHEPVTVSSLSTPHTLLGSGSFEQCLKRSMPLLNKDAPCPDTDCLFNGVYVPPINFDVSHFIGVSEYWYSSEHVFGLGGPYDVVQYEQAASEFCSQDWSDILKKHELSKQNGTLGGDGEVEKNGEIVETGKWGDKVEISRLQMQCFKAAWVVNILHEGIGMPRIVDPGGNSTTAGDKVAENADSKGLGRPKFQSLDSVGDIAISWTLGKMILEASKEVPPLSSSALPIVDPLDDPPNISNTAVQPIRPFLDFDAIEDQISHHLPASLTRHKLGFSPIAFSFYIIVVSLVAATVYRLRHRIRSTVRKLIRKRDRDYISEGYMMEEGYGFTSGLSSPIRPSSPTSKGFFSFFTDPIRQLSPFASRAPRPVPIVVTSPSIHSGRSSPVIRSPAFPPPGFSDGPMPGSPRLYNASIISNGSVASLTSRSRNSSRMDLSSLAIAPQAPRFSSPQIARATSMPATL